MARRNPSPEAQRARALVELAEELLVEIGELADDTRPLCRCLNREACLHWASEIGRHQRERAKDWTARLAAVLGVRGL